MIDAALLHVCAPQVSPTTMQHVVQVESGGNPYALHINGIGRILVTRLEDAVREAERAIALGYSVDIGLMQVNSRRLSTLRLTVRQAFEPCTNLQAGARILEANYRLAMAAFGPGQRAL